MWVSLLLKVFDNIVIRWCYRCIYINPVVSVVVDGLLLKSVFYFEVLLCVVGVFMMPFVAVSGECVRWFLSRKKKRKAFTEIFCFFQVMIR
jgi:hypothetical protein